jgi:tetratricopeptide (TPR) repeat protein
MMVISIIKKIALLFSSASAQQNRAIYKYTKAIEINQNSAEAYYNRGLTYGKKGQYDQAISDFNKAIEISA